MWCGYHDSAIHILAIIRDRLSTALYSHPDHCKVRDLHIIIIFMAITSSITIPQLSRNAWALNKMVYRLCARPFLPIDDVSL